MKIDQHKNGQFAKFHGNTIQAEQLEDRVMFDAVPDAAALAAAAEGAAAEDVPADVQAAKQQEQQADVSRELVLINSNVQDAEQLLAEFFAENQNRSFEVAFLDPNVNGIDQITDLLNSSTGDYDAVHIVSHGDNARVLLGNTWLSNGNLADHAVKISQWASAFSENVDLLFYGCNLAESAAGKQLIASISTLTSADVAASSDLTGHADLDGDWELEVATGDIETVALNGGSWHDQLALILLSDDGPIAITGAEVTNIDVTANDLDFLPLVMSIRQIIDPQDSMNPKAISVGNPVQLTSGTVVELAANGTLNVTTTPLSVGMEKFDYVVLGLLGDLGRATVTLNRLQGGNLLNVPASASGPEDTNIPLGITVNPALLAGGSLQNVIGTQTGFYNASLSSATNFTIPAGATSIRITGLGGRNGGSLINAGVEEDYQATSIMVNLVEGTYSGHIFTVFGQSTVNNDNYAFSDVPLGSTSISGTVTGDYDNNLSTLRVSVTGTTLQISESQTILDQAYLVEYLTADGSSSTFLKALGDLQNPGETTSGFALPAASDYVILTLQDGRTTISADQEDKGLGRIYIDLETGLASGTLFAQDGRTELATSAYSFSGYNINSGLPVLLSGATIVGDTIANVALLPNPTITLSGQNLIVTRTSAAALVYSSLLTVQAYERFNVGSGAAMLGTSQTVGNYLDLTGQTSHFDLAILGEAEYGNVTLAMTNINGNDLQNENSGTAQIFVNLVDQTTSGSFLIMRTGQPDLVSWTDVPFGTRLFDDPNTVTNHTSITGGSDSFGDELAAVLTFDVITNSSGSKVLRASATTVEGENNDFADYAITMQAQWSGRLPVQITGTPAGGTFSAGSLNEDTGKWEVDAVDVSGLEYIPPAHFSGTTTTLFVSYNGVGEFIDILVSRVADAPALTLPGAIGDEDTLIDISAALTVALVDTDGSESISLLELNNIPVGHTVSDGTNIFTATGLVNTVDIKTWNQANLTYQGPLNFYGTVTVGVRVQTTDNDGFSPTPDTAESTGSFDIVIASVNDVPVANADGPFPVDGGVSTSIDVIANDTDLEGDLLTISSIIDPADAGNPILIGTGIGETPVGTAITLTSGTKVTVNGDGTLTIVTELRATGPESFSYEVSDGNGGTGTATVFLERNAAIILNLDPSNTTGGPDDGNFNATFTEVSGPVPVTSNTSGAEATIFDDGTILTQMTLTISGVTDGLYEVLVIGGTEVPLVVGGPYTVRVNGLNYDLNVAASGLNLVVTIDPPGAAASGPLVDFEGLLGDITYENKLTEPTDGDRIFTFIATDGIVESAPVVSTISVPNLFRAPTTVSGNEDVSGGIALGMTNTGATSPFEIDLNNAPVGTTLSHGSDPDMDGIWTIDAADIQNVNIVPPTHYSGQFHITITSAGEVETVLVSLAPQADGLTMNLDDASGDEDTAINIPITTDGTSPREVSLIDVTKNDPDAGEDSPETLSNLELSGIPIGASISDGTITFTATAGNSMIDIVTWNLNLLTITPPENYNGTITLTITAESNEPDNGDKLTSVGTFNVVINPINDIPVISNNDATPTYTQNTAPVALDLTLTVTDADDTHLESAVITVSNIDISNDLLTLNTVATMAAVNAGITVTAYNPLTGELNLSGTATLAEYEAVLEGLLFSSSSGTPGNRTVSMIVNDGEDNSTSVSITVTFITDTTPPAVPHVIGISVDSGISATDGITNDNTPIITGTFDETDTNILTVEVNGTIYTLDLATPVNTDPEMTSDGSGNWTLDLSGLATPLPDGPTNVIAIATDLAGNSAVDPTSNEFLIDTSTADITAPTVNRLITNDQTPTLTGTWDEADATTLTVNVNGVNHILGTSTNLTTDGSGNWTLNLNGTPLLPEATYEVTVTSSDAAGNTVGDSTTNELEIDITVPGTPTVNTLITKDVTPTLTGTWDEFDASILKVTVNLFEYVLDLNSPATSDPQLITDGNGNWTLELNGEPALSPGRYNVTAVNLDSAGNSASDLTVGELTIDVTAPIAATTPPDMTPETDSGVSNTDNITRDTTPDFTGQGGEPGSLARIYATPTDALGTPTGPPVVIGSGPVAMNGVYHIANSAAIALGDGAYNITATFTDPAGNESAQSPALAIVIDTTAPTGLVIDHAATAEIEVDQVVNLVESTDVTLSGNGVEPTSMVAVTIEDQNGNTLGPVTAIVNPDGIWTIPDQNFSSFAEGPITITAVETDTAGNVGPDVVTTLTLDTTPPAQPPVADMTSLTDSAGASNTDDLTNDTTPTFNAPPGTGVPGDTVTLYVDGTAVATGTVNLDGSYELTPTAPLAEGSHNVTISFTDPAGNGGPHSDPLPIIIDTLAPTGLIIDDAATQEIEVDQVVNLAEVTHVTLSGNGVEATSTVSLTLKDEYGNEVGPIAATVNPDGTWTIPDQDLSSLQDGEITVTAIETDAAGNVGTPVETVLEKDTVAPAAVPIAPNLTDDTDTGASNSDDLTNNNTPTFDGPAGTGEPNATVTLYVDEIPVGTTTINSDGSYAVGVEASSSLADGPHNVTVTITDPAGNESAHSPALTIIIDTTAPTGLVIDHAATAEIEVDQVVNLVESTDVTLSGHGVEPTSIVQVLIEDQNGNTIGPIVATVNPDGTWTTPDQNLSSLRDGQLTISAIETDAAGNVGEPVRTTILLDTTPPDSPTISVPIEGDNIVNREESTDVLISGTGEPNATVEVTIDDENPLTPPRMVAVQIDENGNWTLTGQEVDVNSLDDGTLTISAVVTDPAGNKSEPTSITITKDTLAPDAPAYPNMTDESDHGEFIDDEVTNDNTPTFDAPPGSGVPGDTVTLFVNGVPVGSTNVNDDGSYEVTPDLPIDDGEHVVTLSFTDPAGNEGEFSAPLSNVIDTVAPTSLSINLPIEGDNMSNKAESPTVDFSGSGVEPTSIVEVTLRDIEGNVLGPVAAIVNPDGTWELLEVDITSLLDGEITISVIETDLAGNRSEPVTTVIEKDTVAPDDIANSLIPDLDAGSDSGQSDEDEITFTNVPTFTAGPGSANPNETVTVYINGAPAGTALVNEDGSFSVTVNETLPDGEYVVTLTFTDVAGNESVPTAGLPITIDTIPPNIDDVKLTSAGPDFVNGTGEPGATIHLLDDNGNPIRDSDGNPVIALIDEEGNWSIEDISPNFIANDNVTVVITDPAGNAATTILDTEFFSFDSFNNPSQWPGTFDDIFNGKAAREVLFSSMARSLYSQPIISGSAVPGTILIGRIYGSNGAVLGEAVATADVSGNWLLNFTGDFDDETPTVIIEHVASSIVPVGSTRFKLTGPTYSQFGIASVSSRQSSSPGGNGSLASYQLTGDHYENLNPLSVL